MLDDPTEFHLLELGGRHRSHARLSAEAWSGSTTLAGYFVA